MLSVTLRKNKTKAPSFKHWVGITVDITWKWTPSGLLWRPDSPVHSWQYISSHWVPLSEPALWACRPVNTKTCMFVSAVCLYSHYYRVRIAETLCKSLGQVQAITSSCVHFTFTFPPSLCSATSESVSWCMASSPSSLRNKQLWWADSGSRN